MLKKTDQKWQDSDFGSEARNHEYGIGLSALESAILATVTYRDLFDYPVTSHEIHRYLQRVRCGQDDVDAALSNRQYTSAYFSTDGEYFALKNRDALFETRRRRLGAAQRLWSKAVKYAELLASLPLVKMVAVTGSLAVDNPGSDADIDFMLVTDGGRLWSVRAFARLVQVLDARFLGGELCINHFISERALELAEPGLYVAQELTQMVPVFGVDTYRDLRRKNQWSFEFLPNAVDAPPVEYRCDARLPRVRRILETVFRGPVGGALEAWESERKIKKYNETSFFLGRCTAFHAEATGHIKLARRTIETAFADRLLRSREQEGSLRILFGQGYHMILDPKLYKAMQPFPPLGTLYAAGVARSLGYDVRVYDSMLAWSASEWSVAIQVNAPDVVVLYEDNFNYLTKMCLLAMRDITIEMIEKAKARDATVLVCSSDSADEPGIYLQAGADYVLVGEGEDTLAELLPVLAGTDSGSPSGIAGLAFLNAEGALVQTGRRRVIRRLDDLPMPAWDLIDLERYAEVWTRSHARTALNMVTTRGCPYHCNWCAKPVWGQRYNARSPEHVVTELSWLRELTECNYVWFMDDIFGLKPAWVSEFSELMQEAEIEIRFKCLSRPDILLRKGETEALARAGCDIVWMGAESGSQKVLDAMEKGTTVEMIETASALLRENRIRVGLFIQFGYPGETKNDIKKTIKMIRRIMPDELGISVTYPLPGTRFYERVKAEMGNTRNWQDSNDLAMLFRGPFNTAYYRALHSYVHSDLAQRRALQGIWSPRNMAKFMYFTARRALYAGAMAVLSRLPHKGLQPMAVELNPKAAAIPSRQPED